MPHHGNSPSDEKLVPLGVVLMAVGALLIAAVVAVWLIVPATVPRALLAIVAPRRLAAPAAAPVTPAVMAEAPLPVGRGADTAVSVLSAGVEPYTAYPDYFVSAVDAASGDARAGVPLKISIPSIQLEAPVAEVSLSRIGSGSSAYLQWDVPQGVQAGWHNTSARLGQGGNTVLNGHHNIYGEVFRDLVDLEVGDSIVVYDADRAYAFSVSRIEILPEQGQPLSVRLENSRWIESTKDERLTLVTCWPYTGNSHRVVVVAEPLTP